MTCAVVRLNAAAGEHRWAPRPRASRPVGTTEQTGAREAAMDGKAQRLRRAKGRSDEREELGNEGKRIERLKHTTEQSAKWQGELVRRPTVRSTCSAVVAARRVGLCRLADDAGWALRRRPSPRVLRLSSQHVLAAQQSYAGTSPAIAIALALASPRRVPSSATATLTLASPSLGRPERVHQTVARLAARRRS